MLQQVLNISWNFLTTVLKVVWMQDGCKYISVHLCDGGGDWEAYFLLNVHPFPTMINSNTQESNHCKLGTLCIYHV